MIHTNLSTFAVAPTANITVNRNRVKNYGTAYYMNSGSNYEIEIFNPLSSRVLAVIEIDGKAISRTGLVINPAQRVYLERWIDEPKKFKFSTYEVENSIQAASAIANNGKICVTFYEEVNKRYYPTSNFDISYTNTGIIGQPYYINTGLSGTNATMNCYFGNSLGVNSGPDGNLSTYSSGISDISSSSKMMKTNSLRSSSIETGRTERGEISNQGLDSTSGDFNSWPTIVIDMQILPESQKPTEIEKIRSYCTDCGTRVRASSWKFCPSCGSKF